MAFITDQQTLDDLNIFSKNGEQSIYQLFERTVTRGGGQLLEKMFREPLADQKSITDRIGIIEYFTLKDTVFPFRGSDLNLILSYLNKRDERTKLVAEQGLVRGKMELLVGQDVETRQLYENIQTTVKVLVEIKDFVKDTETALVDRYPNFRCLSELISISPFAKVFELGGKAHLKPNELAIFDEIFRFQQYERLLDIFSILFELDAYMAVARSAKEMGLCFPKVSDGEDALKIHGLFHPKIGGAIANDVLMLPQSNLIFLTGANMAGKSTLMKSISLAVYLAHMGFPVPARSIQFPVLDGMFTTINLPDDLGMGASHFYAEVLRVKKVALALRDKKLFVVFDELFRGTNVKDAFEGTLELCRSFSERKNNLFVISTHIIEAGEILQKENLGIQFKYMPTLMVQGRPIYTYQLRDGITADRHGMVIIENEGLLEGLENGTRDRPLGLEKRFVADKQTMSDLNLVNKFKSNSVYSIFNKVKTVGGERLLYDMFHQPMADHNSINERTNLFKFFQEKRYVFPFGKSEFAIVERYFTIDDGETAISFFIEMSLRRFRNAFLHEKVFQEIHDGILAVVAMLNQLRDFLAQMQLKTADPYFERWERLSHILASKSFDWIKEEEKEIKLSFTKVAKYHYLLNNTLRDELVSLLEQIYFLDVFVHVGQVARDKGFDYAVAMDGEDNVLAIDGLWHPNIPNSVTNAVSFSEQRNMMFLTGANMAGKSTFMKALGISVYMAHMGFPVAAKGMKFSVRDGLYSSINVSDNINMGYSHFYAEVLRVKEVSQKVSEGKKMMVLYDELFKGTNVKDAFAGTSGIIKAYLSYPNSFFVISTHIIEVGDEVKEEDGVDFRFLPTVMEGNIPRYTYKLERGITKDRHGMLILENEEVLNLLNEQISDGQN